MATLSKIRENYLGAFLGFLSACFVYFFNPRYSDCVELIKAIPQLTTCIFGFLLTLLGIILQGSGSTIEKMRNSEILYGRFINYNKKIVILSLMISIIALLGGYLNYSWFKQLIDGVYAPASSFVKRVFLSTMAWATVWLIVDMATFIDLFYQLIKKSK